MSIRDYLRRLARRWRIIVGVTVLMVGVTALISSQMTPTYEAEAELYVSVNTGDDVAQALTSAIYAQQQVLSYAAVANSELMADTVIADIGLDATASELDDQISTVVEFGTVLITLTVKSDSPQEARAIATSVIDNYNDVLAEADRSRATTAAISVTPLERPKLPQEPVSPNWLLNLIAGLFAGLLLGISAAALRDLLDNTIKEPEDVEEIGGVQLGRVPVRKGRIKSVGVVEPGAMGPLAESLRQVRVNLQFAAIDEPPQVILVSSCGPSEGKSFVSANIAAVYASSGLRVCLVDADLRRPAQASMLSLDGQSGLTSILMGGVSIEEGLQDGPVEGMSVMTTGPRPPNPVEVLATGAMARLLEQVRSTFDVVIVDTPPLLPLADARALIPHVDGVVLVARHGSTKKADMSQAMEMVESVGGRLLGVLLNRCPTPRAMNYTYSNYAPARRRAKR